MIENSDLHGIEYPSGEPPTVEEATQRKRPFRTGRLAGIALLALVAIVAVIAFTPGLRKEFLGQTAKILPRRVAPPQADTLPLPAVPVLWDGLDVSLMPANVAQDLRMGKYYYDRRLPGNFGLAIDYWRQAVAHTEGTTRDELQRLVASAEIELACQFSSDSGDAFVLLKQGKRAEAVILLEKMRADYTDINAHQYVWASRMLARRRR